jgi:chromosome segregation ATPase
MSALRRPSGQIRPVTVNTGRKEIVASDKKIKDDQTETIKKVNEQIAEQTKTITDLGKTIEGLKVTITQLETGRKHYQDEFSKTNTELHNMTQLKNKLQAQIDAATVDAKLKIIQDQVNELTREKDDLDKQILDKDTQIDELKTEVDDLKTKLASKSSSDGHRKDTKKSKPRKTDEEYKAERERENRKRIQELLRLLQETVHFPV